MLESGLDPNPVLCDPDGPALREPELDLEIAQFLDDLILECQILIAVINDPKSSPALNSQRTNGYNNLSPIKQQSWLRRNPSHIGVHVPSPAKLVVGYVDGEGAAVGADFEGVEHYLYCF